MDEAAVTKDVIALIKPYCKNENALKNANLQTLLIEDLQINSTRLVDIVIDMETKFNLSVDDETASKAQTIGDIVHWIIESK